jgi:hypothetical protein
LHQKTKVGISSLYSRTQAHTANRRHAGNIISMYMHSSGVRERGAKYIFKGRCQQFLWLSSYLAPYAPIPPFVLPLQGVIKRCRLSWLTNSALVYEPKCGGAGGGSCGVSANEYCTAVHIEPNKLF